MSSGSSDFLQNLKRMRISWIYSLTHLLIILPVGFGVSITDDDGDVVVPLHVELLIVMLVAVEVGEVEVVLTGPQHLLRPHVHPTVAEGRLWWRLPVLADAHAEEEP